MYKLLRHSVLLISIMITNGCVPAHRISEHQLENERSSYYPLAVISSSQLPEIYSDSSFDSNVAGTGTRVCGELATSGSGGAIAAAFACIPLMIFDVVAISVETTMDDTADAALKEKSNSMITRLKAAVGNNVLHENTMNVLEARNANASAVNIVLPDTKNAVDDEDYSNLGEQLNEQLKKLTAKGYKKALITNLVLVKVEEREYISKENFMLYCLQVRVNGTLFDTETGDKISSHNPGMEQCLKLENWRKDNNMEITVKKMYEYISSEILEELLFVHYTRELDDSEVQIKPVNPILIIDEDYFLDFKPMTLGEHSTRVNTLRITKIDSTPTFKWEEVKIPGATDIKYDFRINVGRSSILRSRKSHVPFSDEVIPVSRYVKSSDFFYYKGDLDIPSHKPDKTLEPCNWYFWSVKAKYNLNGYPRSTRWSTYWNSSFPIRTKESADNPECWNKKVDWGPIN